MRSAGPTEAESQLSCEVRQRLPPEGSTQRDRGGRPGAGWRGFPGAQNAPERALRRPHRPRVIRNTRQCSRPRCGTDRGSRNPCAHRRRPGPGAGCDRTAPSARALPSRKSGQYRAGCAHKSRPRRSPPGRPPLWIRGPRFLRAAPASGPEPVPRVRPSSAPCSAEKLARRR